MQQAVREGLASVTDMPGNVEKVDKADGLVVLKISNDACRMPEGTVDSTVDSQPVSRAVAQLQQSQMVQSTQILTPQRPVPSSAKEKIARGTKLAWY